MKNKKGIALNRNILLVGAVFFLIAFIYFGFFAEANAITFSGLKNDGGNVDLISEDSSSATYKFTFYLSDSNLGWNECETKEYVDFDYNSAYATSNSYNKRVDYVKEIPINTKFSSSKVEIFNLKANANTCSSNISNVESHFENLSAQCFFLDEGNRFDCWIYGRAVSDDEIPAHFFGITGGEVIVKMYKEGYSAPEEEIVEEETQIIEEDSNSQDSSTPDDNGDSGESFKILEWLSTLLNKFFDFFKK